MEDIIRSVLLVLHFHIQRSKAEDYQIQESYKWMEKEFTMFIDELESKGWDISAVFFHDKGIRWKAKVLS